MSDPRKMPAAASKVGVPTAAASGVARLSEGPRPVLEPTINCDAAAPIESEFRVNNTDVHRHLSQLTRYIGDMAGIEIEELSSGSKIASMHEVLGHFFIVLVSLSDTVGIHLPDAVTYFLSDGKNVGGTTYKSVDFIVRIDDLKVGILYGKDISNLAGNALRSMPLRLLDRIGLLCDLFAWRRADRTSRMSSESNRYRSAKKGIGSAAYEAARLAFAVHFDFKGCADYVVNNRSVRFMNKKIKTTMVDNVARQLADDVEEYGPWRRGDLLGLTIEDIRGRLFLLACRVASLSAAVHFAREGETVGENEGARKRGTCELLAQLVRMSDVFGVHLPDAVSWKVALNKEQLPYWSVGRAQSPSKGYKGQVVKRPNVAFGSVVNSSMFIHDYHYDFKEEIRTFVAERNWYDYETAENVTTALVASVGSLCDLASSIPDDMRDGMTYFFEFDGSFYQAFEEGVAEAVILATRLGDILGVDVKVVSVPFAFQGYNYARTHGKFGTEVVVGLSP